MRDFTEGRTGKLMTDELQYDVMVERALRGVMVEALTLAAEHGLPGNHHFYVTFKTEAPGVNIPTHLAERYPDEMTIVLQFQYWDLEISDEGLAVTLSFNDVRERLIVPFAAVTVFADPSVKFGLQFQALSEDELEAATDAPDAVPDTAIGTAPDTVTPGDEAVAGGEVVSLDHFRKKK